MKSDKEPVHCGEGILKRIECEKGISQLHIKHYTEKELIEMAKELFHASSKPLKEIIIIRNGLTDEQIKQIINFKTS